MSAGCRRPAAALGRTTIPIDEARTPAPVRTPIERAEPDHLRTLHRYGQISIALGAATFVIVILASALAYTAFRADRSRLDDLARQQAQAARAYLAVSGVRVTRFASHDQVDYQVVIHDQGLTPAVAVSNRAMSNLVEVAGDGDVPIASYTWQTPTGDPDVYQGQTRVLDGTYTFGSEDREAFSADRKRLAVYGTFYYQDIYKHNHAVDFCYLLSSFNAEHAGDEAKSQGTSCRNHNSREAE